MCAIIYMFYKNIILIYSFYVFGNIFNINLILHNKIINNSKIVELFWLYCEWIFYNMKITISEIKNYYLKYKLKQCF